MIAQARVVPVDQLRQRTGWDIKPVGACKGDVCVPLPAHAVGEGRVDLAAFAERLGMPLVRDEEHGLWALGPESTNGRALLSAQAPDLVLPDFGGKPFALSWLRGLKVVLTTWASW